MGREKGVGKGRERLEGEGGAGKGEKETGKGRARGTFRRIKIYDYMPGASCCGCGAECLVVSRLSTVVTTSFVVATEHCSVDHVCYLPIMATADLRATL